MSVKHTVSPNAFLEASEPLRVQYSAITHYL